MFAYFYQLIENEYYKKINVYYHLFFLLLRMCSFIYLKGHNRLFFEIMNSMKVLEGEN